MIDFQPLTLENRKAFEDCLRHGGERGCEYSFVNLYLWGRQKAALVHGHMVVFSQFSRRSVYLFPVGEGDKKPVLEAIMEDARQRGIPCRLNGVTQEDYALLEQLYPGRFRSHFDRDAFDYIYDINDLSDLKGRKFQKKRNHLNNFRKNHPDHRLEPITKENVAAAAALAEEWFRLRLEENPHGDYQMEQIALKKALQQLDVLGLEGMLLMDGETPLALTLGSRLSQDTFDVHFEKALDIADGAYPAINQGFSAYLREKYPEVRWLNREEDMGLEGLRKAKLSYCPDHMVEKSWARLLEEPYEY